jgi:hypothetical protein
MDADEPERPPVFRTWRGWYALVLGTLAALIALFTAITIVYR